MKLSKITWLGYILLLLAGCKPSPALTPTALPTPFTTLPPSPPSIAPVQLDTSGAVALLEFCLALNQGQAWDEAAIHNMVVSPPYQALIAHHNRMDAGVTLEAFVEMLLALQDNEPFATDSERLARIHAAYRSACDHTTTLQASLERLAHPESIDRAAARARAVLPPQAQVEATVYILPDGRSSGYAVKNAVVLDLLQLPAAGEIEASLAHELHHIGASSLLPELCPEPGLGAALETLVDMVQEGAATYWVDGWRASPTPTDFELVGTFLQDAMSDRLDADEIVVRKAKLIQEWRGPLYRIGNQMIATLAAARGDDWVQARLGDPVGLLQAWQRETEPDYPFDREVYLLLEGAEAQGKTLSLEPGVEETPTTPAERALGRLTYVRDGDIWIRGLPNGAPQRLTTGGGNSGPRWSPSGEWLLFERDFALWVMQDDGSDARPLFAPGFPRQVAWSPTEDRVAYITEQGELVVTSPPGHPPGWLPGTLIRSTTPDYAQQVTRFAWSPDGQWLACEILQYADLRRDTPARQALRLTRRDGAYVSDLQTTEVDPDFTGSGLQLVGWSRDGAHILFWQGTPSYSLPMSTLSEGLELMSIPDSGGDPRSLAAPLSVVPNLVIPRPASAEVALVTGGGRESPLERQLVLVSPDQPSPRLLSEAGQLVTAQVPQVAPAWSPDSQTIAYAAMPAPQAMPQGEIFDDEILNENLDERRIWVVEADGSGRRQLTDDPAYRDEWPRWSADGQHILFIRVRDDQAGLWLMDDDGSHLQPVVEQLSIAPGASYFDGNRLFDWWMGSESSALSEGRLVVATEQGGAAQQVVVAFLQAVVDGDVEQALSYWNLQQPEAPDNYAEFIRQMVTEWASGEHQFTLELATYGGLVAPGDYRTLDEDDSHVQSAMVDVRIDGLEHAFSVKIVDGHWQIEGLITP